ncbi:hypothetical protein ACFQH9_04280 [Pseudonocardia lutea]|uniref:FXSXX-COOH protein n=1 Tax=Pseudonocardia lutea TaxID=2172015 RepID=A0ABW1I1K6_9PSEU
MFINRAAFERIDRSPINALTELSRATGTGGLLTTARRLGDANVT